MEDPPDPNPDPQETASHQPKSFCALFYADLKSPAFTLKEPNGNTIDLQESFAPSPTLATLLIRAILIIYTIVSIVISIVEDDERWIWIGYLTHWSSIFALVYLICGLACTIKPSLLSQADGKETPNLFVRFLWSMFSVATVFSLCVTFLYWGLLHRAGNAVRFDIVSMHGILAIVLLIDGLVLATIPVKLRQMLYAMLTAAIYLVWQVIHTFTGIGVRKENNVGGPLYDQLDWKNNPMFAAILSVVTIFVMMPVTFLLVWILSMYSPPFKFDGSNRKVMESKR